MRGRVASVGISIIAIDRPIIRQLDFLHRTHLINTTLRFSCIYLSCNQTQSALHAYNLITSTMAPHAENVTGVAADGKEVPVNSGDVPLEPGVKKNIAQGKMTAFPG